MKESYVSMKAIVDNSLIPGAWDVRSFFQNATTFVQGAGGALLILIGTAGVVWSGVMVVRKLWGKQQNQNDLSWFQLAALLLVSGALAFGGWNLMNNVASGGQATIEDLGGGR